LKVEERDVNVRKVLFYGLALAGIVGAVMVGMGILVSFLGSRDVTVSPQQPQVFTPQQVKAPKLQVHEAQDLARRVENDRKELENYGWVDRKSGIVRIPIDRAIDLALQRGYPAREVSPK
jgi:hypothetical protein